MSNIVRRATFGTGASRTPRAFHIEADGVTVDITVGLSDDAGHVVTRVDVSPQDETRGGDAAGRVWVHQPGDARVIRLNDGEDPNEARAQLTATAAPDQVLLVSILGGHTVATYSDPATAERHAERINEAAGGVRVAVEHAPFHNPDDSMIPELLRNAIGK